jgi:hypothetical protein
MPNPIKEKILFKKMLVIYCKDHHHGTLPCPSCQDLMAYAERRIDGCVHGSNKPFCSQCTVHCFQMDQRNQVKTMMRYSGPRMLLHAPLDAFRHLIKSRWNRGGKQ